MAYFESIGRFFFGIISWIGSTPVVCWITIVSLFLMTIGELYYFWKSEEN